MQFAAYSFLVKLQFSGVKMVSRHGCKDGDIFAIPHMIAVLRKHSSASPLSEKGKSQNRWDHGN